MAGFLVVNSYSSVLLAGCCPVTEATPPIIDFKALTISLETIADKLSTIQHIFTVSKDLMELLNSADNMHNWRIDPYIVYLKDLLSSTSNPEIHLIPRNWMMAAHRLAIHGSSLHSLILYHQGKDLPHWLMKCITSNGFKM